MHTRQIAAGLCLALLAVGAMAADERIVAVSGRGEVEVAPDRALLTLNVMARSEQQQAAQSEANEVVANVMRLTNDLNIPGRNVRTTAVQVHPEFHYDKITNKRRISLYVVTRTIEVDLRELEQLGALMEGAMRAGVNQVSPPRLGSVREEEYQRSALAKAAENARANAETLARTLDAKVGPVRRIATADVQFRPPPPVRAMMESRMATSQAAAAETYTSGEIRFEASVNVEFDLLTD